MFNNLSSDETLPQIGENICEDGMTHVNQQFIQEVETSWKNPYLINLNETNNHQILFEKMMYIWTTKYRRKQSTIQNYINDLKRMTNDPILPVDLLKPNPAQIITYLDYHEDKKHPYKTIDPWKAIKALYHMCGIDTTLWGYIPPSPPPAKVRIIPLPEQVKQIINHRYSQNKKNNQTIQKLLNIGFLLGLRPQEYPLIKIKDIYLNQGYLIITEPKKHDQKRQIFPEKDLLINDRRKSIKNQIKLHDKINPDNPYLFLQPNNGNPWTTNYLRQWITKQVKTIYPEFSMYTMRHWCAIARLIQTKTETGQFDPYHVKEWLGHDRIKTTESYIHYAEKYYRVAPYDWIRVLLKPQYWWEQKGPEIENYIKQPLFRVETTGVARDSPDQNCIKPLLLTGLINNYFSACSTSSFYFLNAVNGWVSTKNLPCIILRLIEGFDSLPPLRTQQSPFFIHFSSSHRVAESPLFLNVDQRRELGAFFIFPPCTGFVPSSYLSYYSYMHSFQYGGGYPASLNPPHCDMLAYHLSQVCDSNTKNEDIKLSQFFTFKYLKFSNS